MVQGEVLLTWVEVRVPRVVALLMWAGAWLLRVCALPLWVEAREV